MDQSECHNLQSLNQFITSQFLKKLTQLILSVSLFSFFFSHSSWCSFLLHSFRVLTMDKNYIFLICNGILVFLAKTSGLFKKIGDGDGLQSASEKEVSLETTRPLENVVEEVVEEEEEHSVEGESEDSNLIVEDKDQQEEPIRLLNTADGEEEGGGIQTTEDDENNVKEEKDEEEEDDGLLSTEELNKKFDEFIRRMKEEIRIGAQQQLVMVQ